MKPTWWQVLLILAVLAGAVLVWQHMTASTKQPNIVLITLDTVRADHLSCYGYERKTTPNLDRLASEGQRFENALAVSSWTLPTHASLFTGLFPTTHGAHYSSAGKVALDEAVDIGQLEFYSHFKANGLSDESMTLAETLKNAGYTTGGVGAGPWLKPIFGLSQGFDFYDCDVNSVDGRKADEVTALGMQFMTLHKEAPFFLFLNYFDAHEPYLPPQEYLFKFFDPKRIKEVQNDPALEAEFELSRYDSEIFFMDVEIGRFVDALKKQGIYDDTWIIVIGDHGEHFGEHGLKGHGYSLFENVVRCPLIIKWPSGWDSCPQPQDRCQQVDLMPLILKRLAIEPAAPMEGRPLGEGPYPGVCELFCNRAVVDSMGERFDRNLTALYANEFKLIQSTKPDDRDAGLFDLSSDPEEKIDLTRDRPRMAAALAEILNKWKTTRLDPLSPKKIESIDAQTEEQLKALGYGH